MVSANTGGLSPLPCARPGCPAVVEQEGGTCSLQCYVWLFEEGHPLYFKVLPMREQGWYKGHQERIARWAETYDLS